MSENVQSHIPEQKDNPQGLHRRYTIGKVDGSPVDPIAEYFVLRVDPNGSDIFHINACRAALVVYALEIQEHIPKLAADLRARYSPFVWNLDGQRVEGKLWGKGQGEIVRYFRHPTMPGQQCCVDCGKPYDEHGWIDGATLSVFPEGQRVCPGSWIINRPNGKFEAVAPDRLYLTEKNK